MLPVPVTLRSTLEKHFKSGANRGAIPEVIQFLEENDGVEFGNAFVGAGKASDYEDNQYFKAMSVFIENHYHAHKENLTELAKLWETQKVLFGLMAQHKMFLTGIDTYAVLVEQFVNESNARATVERAVIEVIQFLAQWNQNLGEKDKSQEVSMPTLVRDEEDNVSVQIFRHLMQAKLAGKPINDNIVKAYKSELEATFIQHATDAVRTPSIAESIKDLESPNREALLHNDNYVPWLVADDIRRAGKTLGLEGRLVDIKLENDNPSLLIEHLKLRKKDIDEGRLGKPSSFYVAFSTAGSAQSAGTHWMPLRVFVDKKGAVSLSMELSIHADKAQQAQRKRWLRDAATSAGLTLKSVEAPATSAQSDGASCGYRALSFMAKQEAQQNPTRVNETLRQFAAIDTAQTVNQNHVVIGLKRAVVAMIRSTVGQQQSRQLPRSRSEGALVPPTISRPQTATLPRRAGDPNLPLQTYQPEPWKLKLKRVLEENSETKVADEIMATSSSKDKDNNLFQKIIDQQAERYKKLSGKEDNSHGSIEVTDDYKLALKIAAEEALTEEEESHNSSLGMR